jgi:hypothetical protein
MLYTDATMIMGLVHTSMLFMVVPLVSVLESLDDSLIEAAYDLGAAASVSGGRSSSRTASPVSPRARSWSSCWCSATT